MTQAIAPRISAAFRSAQAREQHPDYNVYATQFTLGLKGMGGEGVLFTDHYRLSREEAKALQDGDLELAEKLFMDEIKNWHVDEGGFEGRLRKSIGPKASEAKLTICAIRIVRIKDKP